jgi:hypothetical protein
MHTLMSNTDFILYLNFTEKYVKIPLESQDWIIF